MLVIFILQMRKTRHMSLVTQPGYDLGPWKWHLWGVKGR